MEGEREIGSHGVSERERQMDREREENRASVSRSRESFMNKSNVTPPACDPVQASGFRLKDSGEEIPTRKCNIVIPQG